MAVESRQAGRDREEITLDDLQEVIAEMVYNHRNSEWIFASSSLRLGLLK